jgi:acyl-CoA oxidase
MASKLNIPKPKHAINPTLTAERLKATFDPTKITHLFDNSSPAETKRRQHLEQLIRNDPSNVFSNDDNYYLHRNERHVNALAKLVRLVELCRSIGVGNGTDGEIIRDKDFTTLLMGVADDLPAALHWVMFVPNIISLADDEQQKVWLKMCRDWKMIGCYAQTEVGHGSNVRALETTATFVKDDKDGHWIINSPTITSLKFWPGTLGRTSNHAMVIAKLIDGEGVDRGIHNFLVQTRSLDDHSLLPGVTCGDIGPKIGYNNMDNGFAKFDHVKIPRRNMAMRFAQVDKSGNYKKNIISDAASKISYITMMQVRAYIIMEASRNLRFGTTIAIRYSAVRKQGFKNGDNKEENQILDYKQQQYRLLPLLAASYCFYFTGRKVLNDLKSIENRLMALSTNQGGGESGGTINKAEVGDIHATTSSLKSFTTTITADGLEDCRKSCGGHGFLTSSGFPELITSYLQNPTVEGDNAMLPMQVVKILLKLVKDIQSGDSAAIQDWDNCNAKYLINPVQAMLNGEDNEKCEISTKEGMMDVNVCLKAYQHRAARLLVEVAQQIQGDVMEGKAFEAAWNSALIQMGRVSRAHSLYLLLNNFVNGIQDESKTVLGPNEVHVLDDLALLFGLYWIEKEDGEFLADGYLSAEQVRWVRSCVLVMLDKIRPNAVALVDANDFTDFRLKSALGRFDGNVYEAILESSKRDPLNATEPGPGYDQHLKRLIVDGVGTYSGIAPTAPRL